MLVHECQTNCDFETAVDTAQHPRRLELSAIPLSEPQISHVQYYFSRPSCVRTVDRNTTSSRNSSKSLEQLSNSDLYVYTAFQAPKTSGFLGPWPYKLPLSTMLRIRKCICASNLLRTLSVRVWLFPLS
jgi:hypothetical protein